MKKIYLKAYINKNLGDDLFIRDITLRYPDIKFYIFSLRNMATGFSDIENIYIIPKVIYILEHLIIKIFHKPCIREYIEKKMSACVYIAGSIFMEPKEFKRPISIVQNDNMYVIGANFGPFFSDDFLEYSRDMFSTMNDICFRDSYSYNMFKDMHNVRWASDVLFGYKYFPIPIKGSGIGISVISLDSRFKLHDKMNLYYNTLAKMIDLCTDKGIKVTLFGFCVNEKDDNAIFEIMRRSKSSADVCIYDGNIQKFLEVFNSCEYILATRFHAMIIGWVLRKKVFPIIYSDKQLNVLRDLNYNGKKWNLLEGEEYNAEILLKDCCMSNSLENIEYYVRNANEQYKMFDEFVTKL